MASWVGAVRVVLDSCESTNDEAARLAEGGAAHGTVVVSRAQTAGRGRHGRHWHAPPGANLTLSCIIRPSLPPRKVPPITLAAGLAVADAVGFYGLKPSLKWPNDVLVGDRKLAGVLTELSTESAGPARAPRARHVIVGIGVNVSTARFPEPLAGTATSLGLEGVIVTPEEFEPVLCERLEDRFDAFLAGGVAAIAEAYTARIRLGQVVVRDGGRDVSGIAVGIDDNGALVVEDASGQRHAVVAGDVMSPGEPR